MNPLLNRIEALLFAARSAMPVRIIHRQLDELPDTVEEALRELIERYERNEGALEVRQEDDGWVLGLRPAYFSTVSSLIPPPVRDAVLATLTHIAREQPVSQSTIIRIRGQKAYNHIRELVQRRWVSKKRSGNSYLLRTTKEFSKVFSVTDDPAEIRRLIEEAGLPGIVSNS